MRVSKLWRTAVVCTIAGSLITAGGLPALAAPAAATPTITIAARTRIEVTGDALVLYRGNPKDLFAKITGNISGAVPGNVVRLYAQPFSHPARLIGSASAAAHYSFTVKPAIATHYRAELVTSSSDPTVVVSSAVVTVYLSSGSRVSTKRGCVSVPVCHPAYQLYLFLPSTLIRRYMSKHWYVYVGVRLAATSKPPPAPKWLYLDRHASVSGPHRITADQYERTVGFSLRIGNDSATWVFLVCAKDTEPSDGIGLPGSHGCGTGRVRSNVAYLG